jgi:hypothetical protein
MVLSVHLTVSFLFLSFLVFDPWKIDYLLNLACGIFSSLGPRNVYKDMLNNMVSPIYHVVMNHQNQTQTNGIWGHVRYTTSLLFYKLCTMLSPSTSSRVVSHTDTSRRFSCPSFFASFLHIITKQLHRVCFSSSSRERFTPANEDTELQTVFVCRSLPAIHWPSFWSFLESTDA